MSGPTARRLALRSLIEIEAGAWANVLVPQLLSESALDRRDRALVTELVYGTTRMQRACDWLVDRHVKGKTDRNVRSALRLGAYQLAFLRTPRHAAVSATVAEVNGPGRGVVNAVLRRVADDVDAGRVSWPDPATRLSYPDWIVARLARDLGPDTARDALEAMNQAATVTERPDGYIQDPGSQMVAAYTGHGPGERILDLCAAPGGKATALAGILEPSATDPGERLESSGTDSAGVIGATGDADLAGQLVGGRPSLVVAADVAAARTEVIAANVDRLGLDNVATLVADGLRPPFARATFDRVLVDAPCSGLGVLRRRPDARWRIHADDVTRLAGFQRRLLQAAIPLIRPGGRLVYSVCTLSRSETAEIDRWLLEVHPRLVPLPPPGPPWEQAGRGALLLPQAAGTDGMFVLALRVPES